MTIPLPRYTQFPNIILDSMPLMSDPEWRVVCLICRKTFGWHKTEDYLSLSQFIKLTGKSRMTVIKGIDDAIEHGFITRVPFGQSFKYRLNLEDEPSTTPTSIESIPVTSIDSIHTKEIS